MVVVDLWHVEIVQHSGYVRLQKLVVYGNVVNLVGISPTSRTGVGGHINYETKNRT